MPTTVATSTAFENRRKQSGPTPVTGERRQFANNYDHLSPDAMELASAIDRYKLQHRRRFITFEEMLDVITSLGYHK